jgi:hypothetical protein
LPAQFNHNIKSLRQESKRMLPYRDHKPSENRGESSLNVRPLSRSRLWRVLVLALLPAALGISGCEEAPVPVFPVSGNVKFKGKPAAGATVVLYATNVDDTHDVAPTGVVKGDGSFDITVYEPGDGAPQGEYVATVQWRKLVSGAGGSAAGPNVLPSKYANPKTSPIKVSVASGPVQIPPINIK